VDCNDSNPCTHDLCSPKGGCSHSPNIEPCDDQNPCTVGDRCVNAACIPGTAKACNDDKLCTDDACDPKQGCISLPNDKACNDGNLCTVGDKCSLGSCQPGAASG
jgi:hypothetical protein